MAYRVMSSAVVPAQRETGTPLQHHSMRTGHKYQRDLHKYHAEDNDNDDDNWMLFREHHTGLPYEMPENDQPFAFDAVFGDNMVLQRAPSKAAIYGFSGVRK